MSRTDSMLKTSEHALDSLSAFGRAGIEHVNALLQHWDEIAAYRDLYPEEARMVQQLAGALDTLSVLDAHAANDS